MDANKRLEELHNSYINKLPDNYRILEEPIDIEVQNDYLHFKQELPQLESAEDVTLATIGLTEQDESQQRSILMQLAKSKRVEAYRAIEAYLDEAPSPKLKSWATLALQESRMAIETDLLGEAPVFVSTGLGGKDKCIRLFIVLVHTDNENGYTDTQKKLVKTELSAQLEAHAGKIERMRFADRYAYGTFLFPLKKELQEVISKVINECNLYGNFLREELLISNVRKLSLKEIREYITNKEQERNQTNS